MPSHDEMWGKPDNFEPRTSTVIRVPAKMAAELKHWAKIKGKTQGALLEEAVAEYVRNHKAELLAKLDELRAEVESA